MFVRLIICYANNYMFSHELFQWRVFDIFPVICVNMHSQQMTQSISILVVVKLAVKLI